MATYKVADPKGIRVSTWKKEQLTLPVNATVQVTSAGQMMAFNKMLTLTADQFKALVDHRRLVKVV